jgi:hypothetical protein
MLFTSLLLACTARTELVDETTGDPCTGHVTCLEAVDPAAATDAMAEYGPDGSCWAEGGDPGACRTHCAAALTRNHGLHREEPACDPDAYGLTPPTPLHVFGPVIDTTLDPVEDGCRNGMGGPEQLLFGETSNGAVDVTLRAGGFWTQDVTYDCTVDWFAVDCSPAGTTLPDGMAVETDLSLAYEPDLSGETVFVVRFADAAGEPLCESVLAGAI